MGRPSTSQPPAADVLVAIQAHERLSLLVFLVVLLGSLASVWWVAPYALLASLIDGIAASVILAPAILFGHALLRLFRFPPLPRRWKFVFSAALGLGFLSILVLFAGLPGLLNRSFWIGLLAFMSLVGVLSLRRSMTSSTESPPSCNPEKTRFGSAWKILWIAAAPFLTLALLAASNPPGMVWQEEGNGYDVLEYHLQLPREYFQNQVIAYAPHNVYANFPANMEMLYLLAMIVHGDVRDIGTTANMIHLAFAVLTVFVAWAIGRDISTQAGIVGGLIVATCTWLEYLSGLAYVENGMLFFGLCALAATLRADRDAGSSIRWSVMAGLTAGFAAGCKYTAIPMIVMPIAVTWLFHNPPWPRRISNAATFVLFALLAASPWLIKNWVSTGNPVFPLANEWFSASPPGWSDEQTMQWKRAHSVGVDVGLGERLRAFWQRVPADHEQRFGPVILSLGLLGLFARRRNRVDLALIVVFAIQSFVWLFATHLYARFAIPMILPLALLACRALPYGSPPRRCFIVIAALLVGASWNFTFAARRHERESAPGASASIFYDGKLPGFEYVGVVNHELPLDSLLLLIGDARPFYLNQTADYFVAFNRNPFFESLQKGNPKETMEWLRAKKYTHILIHWSEVRRIAKTYGFSPPVGEEELAQVFSGFTEVGLRLVRSFSHPAAAGMRYVELYEVPALTIDKQ